MYGLRVHEALHERAGDCESIESLMRVLSTYLEDVGLMCVCHTNLHVLLQQQDLSIICEFCHPLAPGSPTIWQGTRDTGHRHRTLY